MKKLMLVQLIAALLIIIFGYAALTKITAIPRYAYVLSMAAVTEHFPSWFAYGIPIGELLVCTLLMLPGTRKMGLYISLAALIIFTVYITSLLLFSAELPCNCGGLLEQFTWPQHVALNTMLIVVNILAIRYSNLYCNKQDNAEHLQKSRQITVLH
jgi:hypothetical protein